MKPNIHCKFCDNELTLVFGAPGGTSGSVHSISCMDCTSSIPNPLRSDATKHRNHSKHIVYYHWENAQLTAELLILDNGMSIHTNYVFKKTTFAEYIHGGPMELELKDILTIPQKNINPLDPNLPQQIKLWLTFS